MTEHELFYYKMSSVEETEWRRLIKDLRKSFLKIASTTEIPFHFFKSTLDRVATNEAYIMSGGYLSNSGFYRIYQDERGGFTVFFSGYTYEMARDFLVNYCASDISYEYVTQDMSGFRDRDKKDWHFVKSMMVKK